jgi:hypothetical protein
VQITALSHWGCNWSRAALEGWNDIGLHHWSRAALEGWNARISDSSKRWVPNRLRERVLHANHDLREHFVTDVHDTYGRNLGRFFFTCEVVGRTHGYDSPRVVVVTWNAGPVSASSFLISHATLHSAIDT